MQKAGFLMPCHGAAHYTNMPMQYAAIKAVKMIIFRKKEDIFSYFLSKHRLWVHVRVLTIYLLEQNNVYPCKPQFYNIKVGS